jgi:hypothetical protein
MKQEEAKKYLKNKCRLVLSNTFRYTGEVLEVTQDTIIIFDKFNSRVSLNLNEIISCEVLENGE